MSKKIVMPKKLRNKWLAALRSGKYTQGYTMLYNPDNKSFCCLGVLEHIAMDGNVETHKHINFLSGNLLYAGAPSEEFYVKYKIECNGVEQELIGMNDGFGNPNGTPSSFLEIADYIEAHS